MRSLLIPGLTLLGLATVGGLLELQDRNSRDDVGLALACQALEAMPESINDWRGTRFERSDYELQQTLAHAAYCSRLTSPTRSDAEVSVMLLCGETAGLSVHPPTVCFQALGWVPIGKPVRKTWQSNGVNWELNRIDFSYGDGGKPSLRVFWGWSDDARNWVAPDNPRLALHRSRFLYKVYGSRVLGPAEFEHERRQGESKMDPGQEAIEVAVGELLSRLQQLGPGESPASATTALVD